MTEFLKKAFEKGRIKPVEEAFKENPVEEENHKGRLDYYLREDEEPYNQEYFVGDIVFVSKYKYEDGNEGNNHLFVIIEKNNLAVPIDYFGMIISSQIHKAKYKTNQIILKDEKNHLKSDSIVKMDYIYQIDNEQIKFKIGTVEKEKIEEYKEKYMMLE